MASFLWQVNLLEIIFYCFQRVPISILPLTVHEPLQNVKGYKAQFLSWYHRRRYARLCNFGWASFLFFSSELGYLENKELASFWMRTFCNRLTAPTDLHINFNSLSNGVSGKQGGPKRAQSNESILNTIGRRQRIVWQWELILTPMVTF